MYNVFQHWDPLKICIVGRSYPPEFYSFIQNIRVRSVMEKIAQETEEDYQKLITLLESFNVEVWRPDIVTDHSDALCFDKIVKPPMTPRDYSAMIGTQFYWSNDSYDILQGSDWPNSIPKYRKVLDKLPEFVKNEILDWYNGHRKYLYLNSSYDNILKKINNTNNINYNLGINSATCTRIGKDLYFGTETYSDDTTKLLGKYSNIFTNYRCHIVNTGGHSDGTFCPVVPGLIVSLKDVPTYAETFPGWEVIYLPGQSWDKVKSFLQLKTKNQGKWWVPGAELNDEFTEFVENWLDHWVGYVEETVFDVNMLVIDEKNVICNNYNDVVFRAFERHGVTPHVLNFRHRYFWDGGLHCITSDIHREGQLKDYFPERGQSGRIL